MEGAEGTVQVLIQNSLSSCMKVMLLSLIGTVDTSFECSCFEWIDADGDEINADTCFFKDEISGVMFF